MAKVVVERLRLITTEGIREDVLRHSLRIDLSNRASVGLTFVEGCPPTDLVTDLRTLADEIEKATNNPTGE